MLLILDSVILLESVMFGIFSSDHRKKNRLFLLGVFIAGILSLAGVMHNNVLIWGMFIAGHIILLAIYLISYYHEITNHVDQQDLKTLLRKYVKIPTCFYLLLIIAVSYALLAEANSGDFVSVTIILILVFAAGIYNFVENKIINNLSDEQIKKIEPQDLRQYIYRKNALVGIYSIIFSISVGIFYICMFDSMNENTVVLIFFLELIINMTIYGVCYHKVKGKFMAEDQYPKWQLMVPKRVGVGYTFNFNCPFTYIILGIVVVVIIISLL